MKNIIIENLTIKNNKTHFKEINHDLTQTGIYLITGKNGIGKTTLIESLIFDKHGSIYFKNKEHQGAYEERRHELIAYLPQAIAEPKIKVKLYFQKTAFKNEHLKKYLNLYELDENVLQSKSSDLSGGEQVKIAFIAAILKETPYIFLDEPTNNLDDKSSTQLINLIAELSKDRTFIIVTHDPRLLSMTSNRILVKHQSITQINNLVENSNKNVKIPLSLPIKALKVTKSMFLHPLNFFTFCFYIVLISTTYFLNQIHMENNYSTESLPSQDKVLLSGGWEWFYKDFNWRAAEGLNLNIDEENSPPFIPFTFINELANDSRITNIIISDPLYWVEIHNEIYHNTLLSNLTLVNPPDFIWDGYTLLHDLLREQFLRDGRFPNDNAREVTLSEALLEEHFDISRTELEAVNGQTIPINQIDLTVVGIDELDIAIISRHNFESFGFYTYHENTYNDFINLLLSNYEEELLDVPLDSTFIVTEAGYEPELIKDLLTRFPNGEFFSYTYRSS